MPTSPCCDIHAHCIPVGLVEDLRSGSSIDGLWLEHRDGEPWVKHRQGPTYPLDPTAYDLEARLEAMDSLGIDVAVVSLLPTLLFYWVDPTEAADWARTANDDIARMAADSHGRIAGVATLPMQDTDQAIDEAERAVRQLQLKGVQIAPMVLDRTLDEDDYFPVLETLEQLGVPVILHPYFVGAGHRPGLDRYYLTNLAGHPYQTAVGASRLIMSGALDRLPDLRLVLVHGGGYLPYQIGRLDHGNAVRPEAQACAEKPSSYLSRFTFDTITHSAASLQFLVDLVGADHVAYGTDFPADMGGGTADEHLAGVRVDEQATALIRGGNALSLFGLG